ncbi:TPA: hypothetical protein PCJ20_004304 [Klebsiella quasipneumoniae]|nr:hypothetical protein [Klebsiella quasipneumoniae]
MEFIDSKGGFWEMEVDPSCIHIIKTPDEIAQRITSQFYNDAYHIKNQKLCYGFLQDDSVNAFACSLKKSGLDFVGINAGLYPALYLTFSTLLSRSDFMPNIGHSHKEDSTRVSNILIPKTIHHIVQGIFIPKCEIRAAYANILTNLAFEFIVLHECSHLFNGHTDFFKRMNIQYIEERRYSSENKMIILQTIEMDADCCAISFLVNKLFRLIKISKSTSFKENKSLPPGYYEACKLIYTDELSSMVSLNLAIDTLNKLIDETSKIEWTFENQFFKSHPLPEVRRYFNHLQIWSALNSLAIPSELEKTIVLESFKNMMELNLAWGNVKGELPTEYSIDIYNKIFNNPDVHEYYALLRKTWQEIRPELWTLKRGEYLPE